MKIADALLNVRRLAVDTSPIIYFVEPYAAYTEKMSAVFETVEAQNIEVITSVITMLEALTKPLRQADQKLERVYRQLFGQTQNLHLVSIDREIAVRAALLRSRYNVRTPDALQLAVAIETQCDAFLTNDHGLKVVTEVNVLILDDLTLVSNSTDPA